MNKSRAFSFLLLGLLFCPVILKSQSQEEIQGKYLMGKNLYNEGRYQAASEVFLPLTSESNLNSFSKPSAYFYALSTFKLGQLDAAKTMCLQTLQRYPEWEQRDEVYYLLANIYFDQNKPRLAIQFLNKTETLRTEIENLKKEYYKKVEPLDTLKSLQKDYPSDVLLANVLARRLAYLYSIGEKDKMLLNFLMQEYKIDQNKLYSIPNTVIKTTYKVALLLPFQLNEIDPKLSRRSNQYVLDFYEGVKIAADSLAAKGAKVDIYTYDTEKDISILNSIIGLPELKTMDLIIGPVFPNQIPLVTEFCKLNNIININPFSANSKIIDNNEFAMLFQPTIEIQAGEAARFANEKFRQDSTYVLNYTPPKTKGKNKGEVPDRKKVIIFYGNEVKDSLMAVYYKDSCLANKLEVIHFEKINRGRVELLQTILGDTTKLGKSNHVFASTSDEVIAANIMSLIEVSRQNTPLVTRADWLNFNLISFEQFEKRNVFFIQTDYYDYSSWMFRDFKTTYVNKTKIYPSYHSVQGFELMMYFGRALQKYGTNFKVGLDLEGFSPGKIIGGFNYSNSRANKHVTISRFKEKTLSQVNVNVR